MLLFKKQAELALARSGLTWTVVRPGGLKGGRDSSTSSAGAGRSGAGGSSSPSGAVVMAAAGTYGFPPLKASGSIDRSQVRRGRPAAALALRSTLSSLRSYSQPCSCQPASSCSVLLLGPA